DVQASTRDPDLRAAQGHAGGRLPAALLQVEPRAGARAGRLDPAGADEEGVSHRVLIAAELKGLLEPAQLDGLDITWISTDQPTPRGDYVAIVPLLSRWLGGTELKYLPKLKIVANCAVGHDNVDVVAAELRGVKVTNTPDVLTDATADLTWALILACARRVVAGTELVRAVSGPAGIRTCCSGSSSVGGPWACSGRDGSARRSGAGRCRLGCARSTRHATSGLSSSGRRAPSASSS